jgi:N-acetylglucosaminyl-diphospho-decaprenol L-rhamnosyltransferase
VAYSIVVVTYNCAEHLRALVTSMNEHLTGDQELIVVDNASSDDPEAALAEWKGAGRFIALDSNVGFAAGSNRGVAEATAEVSVLLNPDTELVDAGLDRLATVAAELDGLVGPRVVNSDGSIQASASGPEVGIWPWVRALLPGAAQPTGLLAHTEPYRLERRTPVSWLTGACIAGPTRIMRRLGPFDPALHMFGEDVDLGLRASAAGVQSWFDPEACRIVHHGQGSSTLVYGSREGWRPTGTVNWRAALRRAYGARREYLGWMALRLNLRLRLAAKTLLGRASDRDREAVRAASAARPVPELEPLDPLDPAAILSGGNG